MRSQERSPRIMVTCAGRIPSVELAAIIPFTELQKRKQCIYEYRDESSLTFQDIMWCDILFVMRGVSNISLWAAIQAKKYGKLVMGYWYDDLLSIPSDNPNFGYYSNQEIKNNIN